MFTEGIKISNFKDSLKSSEQQELIVADQHICLTENFDEVA